MTLAPAPVKRPAAPETTEAMVDTTEAMADTTAAAGGGDTAGALAGMKGTTPLTPLSDGFKQRLFGVDPKLGDFVYAGGHPCFIGPHALFRFARGVPELHPGYRPARRYDDAEPGVFNREGLRARVGASHLPLGAFVTAFTAAGLRVEHFEEDGEDDYPYLVALVARR